MIAGVLAAQAFASAAMCGVIWFVQVVHYPLFAAVAGDAALRYSREHRRRTPWVVVPLMFVEFATAAWLAAAPPPEIGRGPALAGLGLVCLLGLSTWLVQMPLHSRLGRHGHDHATIGRLVGSNWCRTILWTARAVLAVWMLAVAR